jgi:hypothetical protein
MSPAWIGYEMKKAYDYNARKLWVFNVGDIKPAELEMQFALDMAWDITTYNATNPDVYIHKWATETFGSKPAADIVRIKKTILSTCCIRKTRTPEYAEVYSKRNLSKTGSLSEFV